jgi:putative RNA 2'-phosphotransferase
LSYILRHRPDSAGLTLDENGWAEVGTLIYNLGITRKDLEFIVENNNKKRFEFSDDGAKIRARQGHSVDVDLGYEELVPPDTLYHGTVGKVLDDIRKSGLLKMNRHHVHMSPDEETAIIVGRRRGRPVVLEIKAGEMCEAGHKFYKTDNNVWLTDRVPPEYLIFPKISPSNA